MRRKTVTTAKVKLRKTTRYSRVTVREARTRSTSEKTSTVKKTTKKSRDRASSGASTVRELKPKSTPVTTKARSSPRQTPLFRETKCATSSASVEIGRCRWRR